MIAAVETAGAHDFDFLHGSWRIANERLVSRLSNSDQRERFEAEGTCQPILGGIGNIDSFRPRSGDWQGYEGAALRLYHPESGLWSIYWADTVLCGLTLPVVGRFTDNVGEFFGDDTHGDRPVRVRFRWSGISPTTARWEQAFSADGGVSWETNWAMAFTREDARKHGGSGMVTTTKTTISTETLNALGNVPASYVHEWRVGAPQEPLVLPGSIFKWYQVHREGVPVAPEIDAAARAEITAALAAGAWDPSYGLNFGILHVSTTHAFLLAGVWRGHQELWERVYARDLAADTPFQRIDASGEDVPVGCVWELGATCHERMAWSRYLFTERTEADKRTWLEDLYAGPV